MNPEEIVAHQPVGSLIVDSQTIVRFANPAAAAMLGVPADRLVGEVFGLPLLPGGVTDVNVPGDGESVRTLAMRVSELPTAAERYLVTLFDVSGRARRYEHEHRLVESLQRSILLDEMPTLAGARLAARYVPGDGEVRVGGDWYDAIPMPGNRLGLAIGDVAGHGIGSAALMSQLRNALRAYALEHPSPAAVVDRLDDLIDHLEPGGMATMIYLVYEFESGKLTFAAAGHPYPLLVGADGATVFLQGGRSMPLGTGWRDQRDNGSLVLPPSSTLVLYTDGLIERRTRSLDDGFASLAANVHAAGQDPDTMCDAILDNLLGEAPPDDDVAMLVMQTTPTDPAPVDRRPVALAKAGG
jgi:serine phosphatase RsbU (regulator of sigma subunit)